MKSKLTLLFILIASFVHAQYDYPYNESMFGLGVGYNFHSIVGDDVRPIELSFRYRINDDHMLQLYAPILRQDDLFKSKGHAEMELVDTSLDSKKRLYGIGVDYDYVLQSFFFLDVVIGLRAEYQFYKYRTTLTNSYRWVKTQSGGGFNSVDITFRDRQSRNYVVSPNAGLRMRFNRFSIDAKFLLSMLSIQGDVDNRIESKKNLQSDIKSTTDEWTDELSDKLMLKSGIMMSISYFFNQ